MSLDRELDVKTFMKQKEAFKKHATAEVAVKLSQVKMLLKEVGELVAAADLKIRLGGSYGELTDLIETVDSQHPDWNSSSYDC